MKNNIEEIVVEEISKYFDIESGKINMSTNLNEFQADSLDAVQLGTNLEQIFDIDFTFKQLEKIKTIQDICLYIESEIE